MKKTTLKKLARFLPVNLFIAVFLFDLFTLFSQLMLKELMVIRDLVLMAGFLLLLPVFSNIKWLETKVTFKKIKLLLVCMIGMYVALWYAPAAGYNPSDYSIIRTSLSSLTLSTITSLLSMAFGILILLKLRELIIIKRKRTTQRNFRLLIILMASGICYAEYGFLLSNENFNPVTDLLFTALPGKILLGILIMLVVINSFRNSWISYLTKKQKVRSLFLSILFGIGPGIFYNQINSEAIRYSLAIDTFIMQLGLVLSVYWFMAAIVILFHLPTAGIVDRKMKEINSFRDLSRSLSSEFNFDKLILKISGLSIDVTGANATYLQILDSSTGQLRLVSSKNLSNAEIQMLNDNPENTIGNWVVENRQAVWVNNVNKDQRLRYLRKWKRRFESVIAVPLISYDKILGVLCTFKTQEYGFIPEDLDLMQAFAEHAAIALENSRLVQESIEKERLKQELKVAHTAQMKLLPKTMPQVKGLDIDAICITANDVGGDYYDFFVFDEDRVGIVVADVSGKGAQAAFYMAEVKGIIKSLCRIYRSPREVLIKANEMLYEAFERTIFVSLIYAIIDKKKIVFSRAGHCPLLRCQSHNGGAEFIEPRGIGLGLTRGPTFEQITEEKKIPLSPGDTLLFFTDGVVEARNRQQQEFEEETLRQIFSNLTQFNSTEIKNKLIGEIRTFVGTAQRHDDLTMVVVKIG